MDLHRNGVIEVFVGSISASENQPNGLDLDNFRTFEQRLEVLGLEVLPRVFPVFRLGMSYLGEAVLGGEDDQDLEEEIRSVVHPNSEGSYADHANAKNLDIDRPIDSRWRNAQCDIDGLMAHIREGHDIFVTEDRHFVSESRRPRLIALGAGRILTPHEALAFVTSSS